MRTIKTLFLKFKIYWPSAVLYSLVALYFILPVFSKSAAAEQAKTTLTQIQHSATPSATVYTGHPAQLSIERLGINLTIEKGAYDITTQTWTLDSSHVFVDAFTNPDPIISTEQAVQPYKVLFYGHHTSQVLGKTDDLVAGDILTIRTYDGYVFSYYYVSDQAAQSGDVTVLGKARESTPVALLTCGGGWDQFRRIMYFAPLGVTRSTTITDEGVTHG